jgi:hypothetical protein
MQLTQRQCDVRAHEARRAGHEHPPLEHRASVLAGAHPPPALHDPHANGRLSATNVWVTPIRRLAVLLLALALAYPASVLADSAGDQQYQDPLGNTPSKPKPKTHTTTPTTTPAPTQTTPSQSTSSSQTSSSTQTTTTSSSSQSNSSSSGKDLPRTGLDIRVLVGIGVAMIALGFLLRRVVSDRRT